MLCIINDSRETIGYRFLSKEVMRKVIIELTGTRKSADRNTLAIGAMLDEYRVLLKMFDNDCDVLLDYALKNIGEEI